MPGMRYQPQGAIRIDWSNPLTSGLIFAFTGGIEAISGKRALNLRNTPTTKGIGHKVSSGGGSVANISSLSSPGTSSITIFSLLADVTVGTGYQGIVGKWDNLAEQRFAMGVVNGQLTLTRYSNTDAALGAVSSSPLISLAVVQDSTSARGYANGVQIGTNAASRIYAANTDTWYLGCFRSGALSENLPATNIATFVFSRALSAAEIKRLSDNPWQLFADPFETDDIVTLSATIFSSAGSTAGSSTLSSNSVSRYVASGAAQGVGSLSAVAAAIFKANASSASIAGGSGNGIGIFRTTGASTSTGGGSATSLSIYESGGSAGSLATVSGNGYGIWNVIGGSSGVSVVDANASGVQAVNAIMSSAESYGTSTASASTISFYEALANAISYASANANTLSRSSANAGATGAANVQGDSVSLISTTGGISSQSDTAANATMIGCAVGESVGFSGVDSISVTVQNAEGLSISASEIEAITGSIVAVLAATNGQCTVSGKTEGGAHYTAVGDSFGITLVLSPYRVTLTTKTFDIIKNETGLYANHS